MNLKTHLLVLGSLVLSLGLSDGLTAAASKSYLTTVKDHSFMITQRKIILKKTPYRPSITLPKGTIVQAGGISTMHTTNILVNTLSYHLRKAYIGNGNTYTQNIPLTTTNFKKISVPAYTKYYPSQTAYPINSGRAYIGNGELYQGVKFPEQADQTKAKANLVTVTSDGYLEYTTKAPITNLRVNTRPSVSAKITKVSRPGGSGKTYLYTKAAVPSSIGKRVSKTGNAQYLTIIKRRYRAYTTLYTSGLKPQLSSIYVSAGYLVGDQQYFMVTSEYFPSAN